MIFRVRRGALAGEWAGAAGSPCGQVFGLVVYDYSRSYCGGFLGGEPPRAFGWRGREPLRASIWVGRVRLFSFLLQGISRLTLEMTSVFVWFYNVISTGVRVFTRTQWRNPPRERHFVRVRLFSLRSRSAVSRRRHLAGAYMFRSGSIAGDFSTSLEMTSVFVWFIMSFRPE